MFDSQITSVRPSLKYILTQSSDKVIAIEQKLFPICGGCEDNSRWYHHANGKAILEYFEATLDKMKTEKLQKIEAYQKELKKDTINVLGSDCVSFRPLCRSFYFPPWMRFVLWSSSKAALPIFP